MSVTFQAPVIVRRVTMTKAEQLVHLRPARLIL